MRLPVVLLAAIMLVAGSLNTIATKIQDGVHVGVDRHGHPIKFKHPGVQTSFMFAGEALALLPYALTQLLKRRAVQSGGPGEDKPRRSHSAVFLAFALPALCDATATTLLNLGLFYTYASVFQMLRGTLVLFAALLTVVLLKRRLRAHNWAGLVLITAGAALVGASSLVYGKTGHKTAGAASAPNPLLGDALIVLACFFNALQFILEEKWLRKLRAPVLLAVGAEGVAGLAICALVLPVLGRLPGRDGLPIDDAAAAVRDLCRSWTLQWTTGATVLSIAAFNFAGVSVTKRLSGASRAAIDACRTALVWLFCLSSGWERFHMLQLVGFAVLLSGSSVYNDILRSCLPEAEGGPAPRPRSRQRHGQSHRHRRRGSGDGEERLLQSSDEESDYEDTLPVTLPPAIQQAAGQASAAVQDGAPPGSAAGPPPQLRPPPPPRSRAIAAGHHGSVFTMARSINLLPGVLSPHSLGSVPSATWQFESVPSTASMQQLQWEAGSASEEEDRSSGSGSETDDAGTVTELAAPRERG